MKVMYCIEVRVTSTTETGISTQPLLSWIVESTEDYTKAVQLFNRIVSDINPVKAVRSVLE